MAYVKITNFAIKDSTNDVIRGTEHDDEYNAIEASFVAQPSATQTLTNKTIALGSNTVSGTTAQFNTALSDGDFATLAGTETLTNKALNGSLGATTPSTVVATDLTTTGNTILGNASTDTLNVGNGDLVKDASGNVGLGVTPSAWRTQNKTLQIGATGVVSAGTSSTTLMNIGSNYYIDSGSQSRYIATDFASNYQQTSGTHVWYTAPSGTAGTAITFTQAMTLDASGNLSTTGYITSTGTETVRVLADKEISFGSNTASLGIGQYFATSTTRLTWFYRTGGTTLMELTTGGNLTISGATATKASGTTWANPSDIRLKDNVTDYSKGLAELMQVNVKEWTYNGKGNTTEGMKGLGVIADEVMEVLPDTVENYQAKLNADDEADTDIKKFDATEITWLMLNSIKEQQALITSLTARLEVLEAK